MPGYFENSSLFYLPQLKLAATPLLGNLRENYLHWQASVEIVCVLRGSVTVEVARTPYQLSPGDVLTIDPYRPHRYAGGTADGLQLMMTIDDTLLHRQEGECYALSTVGAEALSRSAPVMNELRSSIGRLCELLMPLKEQSQLHLLGEDGRLPAEPPAEPPAVSARTWHAARMETHLICMLLSEHIGAIKTPPQQMPEGFLRCIEYIHDRYHEPCTAQEVARACGFSERSLRRLFQQHMGQSFGDYVTTVRLIAARSMLENTDSSIADTAASVGLSVSGFYRAFHRATGTSPKEYQDTIRKQDVLPYSPMHLSVPLLCRNLFVGVPTDQVDWDWVTGRKGWAFD